MKKRTPALGKGLAGKALAVPLSVMLATGLAPAAAFAGDIASADVSALQAEAPGSQGGAGAGRAAISTQALSETLYRLYLPVLFRAENGMGEFADSYQATDTSRWAPEYQLFDIANDGTPELLVRTSSFGGNNMVHVFTVRSGSLVKLGSYWEWAGGSAGNSSGQLFAAGWSSGSSYVNEQLVEGNQVVTRHRVSGKATDSNPGGDVQAVNDYLAKCNAKWLSFTRTNDYSALDAEAKYSLTKGSLKVASAGVYTGAAKMPDVTVQFNGDTLEKGVDYEVAYKNNVNAGTATATVTGKGEYQDSLSSSFTIAQANIATSAVTVASGGAYTGAAKAPAVVARVGGKALRQGVDYQVSYRNNTNAGAAAVTVTGKGNYTGTRNAGFTIAKAANPMSLKASAKTLKLSKVSKAAQTFSAVSFSGKAQGKVTYKNVSSSSVAKKFSVNKSTGAITAKKGVKKGTYTVKVQATAAGNGNFNALNRTAAVKVSVK